MKTLFNNILRMNGYEIRKFGLRGSIQYLQNKYGGKELTGVEIGVWTGQNTKSILDNLNIKRLYLIDPWEDYQGYEEDKGNFGDEARKLMIKRLTKYNDKLIVYKMLSEDAVEHIKEKVDFVYIDGNHSYEYVKKDLELYWNILKKDGVLMGDDFGMEGVAKAVVNFCKKNNLNFHTQYTNNINDNDFIISKREIQK